MDGTGENRKVPEQSIMPSRGARRERHVASLWLTDINLCSAGERMLSFLRQEKIVFAM